MVSSGDLGKPERFLYGVLAFLIFVGGCVFLVINSYILGSGASRSAYSENEKYAFALAAGMVPWFIAVMPLLITNTWRKYKWFPVKVPSIGTAAIIGVWSVFIVYNLMGGSGAIATERGAVVSSKDHANSTFAADKERRLALIKEAEGVPQARPEGTVSAIVSGEKLKRTYELSDSCSDPKNKTQRTFCVNLQALEGEQQAAKRRAEIQTEVAALDAKIAATGDTVGGSADPQADMIYAFSCSFGCWDKASIALWIPAATPIVLEIGASTSWYFAGIAFGIAFGRRAPPKKAAAQRGAADEHGGPAAPILVTRDQMERAAISMTSREIMDARRTCDQFFALVATPSSGGADTERVWFEDYEIYCQRKQAKPVELEMFRRVAFKYIPRIAPNAGGEYVYYGMMCVLDKAMRKIAAE
jgi:uncharacterized membrane protein